MSIVFNAEDHSYVSVDPNDEIKWTSVTTLISSLKKPFDAKKVAEKVSKSKRSKWYGIDPKIIVQIWDNEANRATTLGTFYHNQRETDLCSLAFKTRSLSSECPLGKWQAIATEEEEDALDNLKD